MREGAAGTFESRGRWKEEGNIETAVVLHRLAIWRRQCAKELETHPREEQDGRIEQERGGGLRERKQESEGGDAFERSGRVRQNGLAATMHQRCALEEGRFVERGERIRKNQEGLAAAPPQREQTLFPTAFAQFRF